MILKVQLLKGCSINVVQAEYYIPDEDAEGFFKKLHKHIKKYTDNFVAKKNQNESQEKG